MSAEERATTSLTAFGAGDDPEPQAIEYRLLEPGKFAPRRSHEHVHGCCYRTEDPSGLDLADELGAIEVVEWGER